MKNKILKTIQQHHLLEKGMHVVVGLSGGPDSLCMFDVLCRMAESWELKLYPVHVNHRFRPGAAEADQAFVEAFCEEAGWPCRSFVRDCNALAEAEGLTSEEAGRRARYEAFSQVASEIASAAPSEKNAPVSADRIVIAVGQNADDQAETVLFRLLRGTGVDGLAGIAYKRWEYTGKDKAGRIAVIRPLLDCSRKEIEAYCTEHHLEPCRDHTNEEAVYMRNRIRLQLLPLLRETYNSNITEGLNRLAASAAADSDYLWQETERIYDRAAAAEHDSSLEFSLEVLDSLHQAIRIRLYNKALAQLGLRENISAAHLSGIEAVRTSASPSAVWNLPEGYTAEKRYDRLCFFKLSKSAEPGKLVVTVNASPIADAFAETEAAGETRMTVQFDAAALAGVYGPDAGEKIVLRTRQTGDFMTVFTGGGLHRKKLQDLLVDMKVPKSMRDRVQLAAIGSEILWILPDREQRGRRTSAYKPCETDRGMRIVLEYLF